MIFHHCDFHLIGNILLVSLRERKNRNGKITMELERK